MNGCPYCGPMIRTENESLCTCGFPIDQGGVQGGFCRSEYVECPRLAEYVEQPPNDLERSDEPEDLEIQRRREEEFNDEIAEIVEEQKERS